MLRNCTKYEKGEKYENKEYYKIDCVDKLPPRFEEKEIGKSQYYKEMHYNDRCSYVKLKKVNVDFIDQGYIDGSCIKDGNFYKRFYCEDEDILIYVYKDSNCQKIL